MKLFYLNHMKCGSIFIRDLIAQNTTMFIVDFDMIKTMSTKQLKQITLDHKHVFFRYMLSFEECKKILPLIDDDSYGIAVYRNKVDAVVSLYKYYQKGKKYGFNRREGNRIINCVPYHQAYESMKSGQYADLIKVKFDYATTHKIMTDLFPLGRYRYIKFEEMIADTHKFVTDLLTWIDLIPEEIIIPPNMNASYWPKNYFLHRIVNWIFHKATGLDSSVLHASILSNVGNPSLFGMCYRWNKLKMFLTDSQRKELNLLLKGDHDEIL